MSQQVFAKYAQYYDALYREKDYQGEAAFILSLLDKYLEARPQTLLDVGCGTGGHLLHFAEAGLRVTGIDTSGAMVRLAKKKTGAAKGKTGVGENPPELRVDDVRCFDHGKTYDSCIAMFAVIGYLNSNDDLASAFACIRRSLRTGGLFIFDVWFGPSVLLTKPETRIKEFETKCSRVIRTAVPELDIINNIVTVRYSLLELQSDRPVAEVRECHRMRFFFIPELQLFLQHAGFDVVKICRFMDDRKEPTAEDWNISVISKAV